MKDSLLVVLSLFVTFQVTNEVWAQDVTGGSKDNSTFQTDLATVVSIVGIFGAIGALTFNGITQLTQNKNQYYQIMKDFDEQYTKLGEIGAALDQFTGMPFEVLSRQSQEIVRDVELYRWKFYLFHEKIAHLALSSIIPKKIARYYKLTFALVLYYIDIDFTPDLIKKDLNNTLTWCEKENITKSDIL